MHQGQLAFAQLMRRIPLTTFRQAGSAAISTDLEKSHHFVIFCLSLGSSIGTSRQAMNKYRGSVCR